ncbi:P1 family peptidase [Sandaracinobacter sp. RS1-74]|uniref:P1 family peptidase n=1 Tax=Sandaracinobacteroides sayramensis TaxID=2913411 RepID=UPI001EDBC58E|nr:P1 family peptidase [Sandaracinobacteroides sayramensis]MCG2841175.1 P1 family peptidase [Sandaracinobacteroides sayramensis]
MLPGLKIGQAHCPVSRTGVTLLLPDSPVVMACDVRGGGPGTRETDALEPSTLVERVHALALSGGSVFGLEAASELALLMARDGCGLPVAEGVFVPVIPSAILFDLANGGDKSWTRAGGGEAPYRRLAHAAYESRGAALAEGGVGAGFGARAGSRAGGIGIASAALDGGGRVAALVAVNCFGEVEAGEPPLSGPVPMPKLPVAHTLDSGALNGGNTCIGAIATDVPLTRAAAKRLAMMAHDGLARTIRPIHTPFDGDALFAMSLSAETPARGEPLLLAELGTRAADCVANAVRRAVALSNPA